MLLVESPGAKKIDQNAKANFDVGNSNRYFDKAGELAPAKLQMVILLNR